MSFAFAGIASLLLLQTAPPQTPRAVVTTAILAHDNDSTRAYEALWQPRAARDIADRAAQLGLATLARLSARYATADSIYRILEQGRDGFALYAGIGRAWGDLLRTPFDQTQRRSLALAVRARELGDSGAAAEALAIAGFLGSRLGGLAPALDTLDAADRLVPAEEPWLHALIACTRAPILSFGGSAQAWATGQRGLELSKATRLKRLIGFCYQALSFIAINDFDDPGIVEVYADSAEAMQLAARDSLMLSVTTYNRGYNHWVYADLAKARQALHLAVQQGEATGCLFTIAWSYRWLSAIHWQAGDLAPTLRDFAIADSLFTRINDGFGLSNMRNGRAHGYLAAGKVDEAERIFKSGLAHSERGGVAEGVYSNLVNLAAIQSARADWKGARRLLEQAISYGNTHGHAGWTGSLSYSLGIVDLRLGDLDRAEREFRAAQQNIAPNQYMDQFASHVRLAEVSARRGDLDRTVRDMEAAARQLDSLRATLEDEQLKLMVFQTRSAFDEPDLGLAPIAELLVRGGRAADALRLAEQRRGRNLAERLIKDALLRGRPVPRSEAAGLPDLEDLRSRLPEGTAMIEYLTGRGPQATTVFTVIRAGVSARVLQPADSLTADLDRFAALTERGESAPELAQRLSAALLQPALADLPDSITELILVPDGRLHRIPFDALWVEGEPLVNRYVVSRAPSAVIALQLLPRPARTGPARMLALGDPRFSNETGSPDPDTEVYRSGYTETGGLVRLAGSSREARTVARFSRDAVVRLREEASEAYLKRAMLDSFQIIHFATHALVDDQSPGRSSLALTPGGGEDGFLGAAELAQLRLGAELVVLSACRTAGGALIGGEGVQGLTAPFLAAGARAVVATLWPIGDRRTQLLVEDMYRSMARGATVGTALQQAKRAARARGESAAVWAAFTLVGDPDVRLSLVEPRTSFGSWATLTLLIFVAGLALRRVMQKRTA